MSFSLDALVIWILILLVFFLLFMGYRSEGASCTISESGLATGCANGLYCSMPVDGSFDGVCRTKSQCESLGMFVVDDICFMKVND